MKKELRRIEERITGLGEGHARLEEGHARLGERIGGLEEGHARLEKGQARLGERIGGLEEGHARLGERIGGLEEGHARLEVQVTRTAVLLGEFADRTTVSLAQLADQVRRANERLDAFGELVIRGFTDAAGRDT